MSRAEPADASDQEGVAGLGAFRGRTSRFGVPVLPPGWRPEDQGDRPAVTTPTEVMVRPVEPPSVDPVGSRSRSPAPGPPTAPEAQVLPADAVGTEVRVVRRVRPWSVWKLSLAFALCMVAVVTTAAAVLWAVAAGLGVVDNVEGFVEDLGFDSFTLDGGSMLRALVLTGLIVSVAASVMASVLAVMFNLLSDLTGGIEAELAPKRPGRRARRSQARRRFRSRRRDQRVPVEAHPEPPPEMPPIHDDPVPAAGVEVQGRNGTPVVDLTDDSDGVDLVQLALDDLLADQPPRSDKD